MMSRCETTKKFCTFIISLQIFHVLLFFKNSESELQVGLGIPGV